MTTRGVVKKKKSYAKPRPYMYDPQRQTIVPRGVPGDIRVRRTNINNDDYDSGGDSDGGGESSELSPPLTARKNKFETNDDDEPAQQQQGCGRDDDDGGGGEATTRRRINTSDSPNRPSRNVDEQYYQYGSINDSAEPSASTTAAVVAAAKSAKTTLGSRSKQHVGIHKEESPDMEGGDTITTTIIPPRRMAREVNALIAATSMTSGPPLSRKLFLDDITTGARKGGEQHRVVASAAGHRGRHSTTRGDGRVVLGDRSNNTTTKKNDISTRIIMGDSKPSVLGGHLSNLLRNQVEVVDRSREEQLRTKSARRKKREYSPEPPLTNGRTRRLSVAADTTSSRQHEEKRPRTSVQFLVPAVSDDDDNHDHKHFGLIEGIGGGYEEKSSGRNNNIPHRGRMLELPGSVMHGNWEALILNDVSSSSSDNPKLDYGVLHPNIRLSLRHVSSMPSSSPLENYYLDNNETSAPNTGTHVSLISPADTRIDSFMKQGVFTDDELDFCIEDEHRMASDSSLFVGCLSLVLFDGFSSVSELIADAKDVVDELLSKCKLPDNDKKSGERHTLLTVVDRVKDTKETETIGILFPCKIEFDNEYCLLIAHDDMDRIVAIDVIFRKPKTPEITSSSHFGLKESMLMKHIHDVGSDDGEIMKRFDIMTCFVGEEESLHSDNEKHHSTSSSIVQANRYANEEKEVSEYPGGMKQLDSTEFTVGGFNDVHYYDDDHHADAKMNGGNKSSTTVPTLSRSPTHHHTSSKQLSDATVLPNDRFGTDQIGVDEKSLIVEYEEFEKRCQAAKYLLLNAFDDNNSKKDADSKYSGAQLSTVRDFNVDRQTTKRSILRRSVKSTKTIVAENGASNESLLESHRGNNATQRRNGDGDDASDSNTARRKSSTAKGSVIVESQSASRKNKGTKQRWSSDGVPSSLRTAKAPSTLRKATRRQSLPSASDVRMKQLTSSMQRQQRLSTTIKVTSTNLSSSSESTKKRSLTLIHTNSSVKKRKVVTVVDLFGESDSLFGCEIKPRPKTPHVIDKDKISSTKSNTRKGRASTAVSSDVDPKRIGNPQTVRFSNGGNKVLRGNNVSETTAVPVYDSTIATPLSRRPNAKRSISVEERDDLIDTTPVKQGNNIDLAETFDDLSISSTGGATCDFGNDDDVTHQEAIAQSMYDVYFGQDDDHVTGNAHPTMIEYPPSNHYQNLHDTYFGHESVIDDNDTDDEEYSAMQLRTHGIYFGLDDNLSNQSEVGAISWFELYATIPFHDYYFGQETFCDVDVGGMMHLEQQMILTKKKSPRCVVQWKPVWVMILFAWIITQTL